MRTDVLGIGFDDINMDEAVKIAEELMEKRRAAYAVTPNPEIVWLCRNDPKLKKAVEGAALVIPDGIGIIYGAKILGRPLKGKMPGIDFAERLFAEMAKTGKSVYFFGSKPGVAKLAAANLKERFNGLVIAGTHDGYFNDDTPIIDDINEKKPDLLLVCLGAPKQECWMHDNAEKLDAGFMAGLGGSLDVFAGVVERAPENWRRLNLEWLYRLKREPRRITRMIKLPMFLLAVIGQRIRRI
ncbi:MAG: WecB/TagA/CpsF family glycosyltransferase [Oscillospiraceae bacterium]